MKPVTIQLYKPLILGSGNPLKEFIDAEPLPRSRILMGISREMTAVIFPIWYSVHTKKRDARRFMSRDSALKGQA